MSNTRLFQQLPEVEPEENDFPAVPLQIVEALEEMYPDRLPGLHTTDRELGQLIGHVDVVRFLREMSGKRT